MTIRDRKLAAQFAKLQERSPGTAACGGALRQIHLLDKAIAALAQIRARDRDETDGAVIERLLQQAERGLTARLDAKDE